MAGLARVQRIVDQARLTFSASNLSIKDPQFIKNLEELKLAVGLSVCTSSMYHGTFVLTRR